MERADERAREQEDRHGLVGLEDQRREGVGRRLHRPVSRVRNCHHCCKKDWHHITNCFSW